MKQTESKYPNIEKKLIPFLDSAINQLALSNAKMDRTDFVEYKVIPLCGKYAVARFRNNRVTRGNNTFFETFEDAQIAADKKKSIMVREDEIIEQIIMDYKSHYDLELTKFRYNYRIKANSHNDQVKYENDNRSLSKILEVCCGVFGYNTKIAKSSFKKTEIVFLRNCYFFYSNALTNNSLSNIGRYVGKKNHSTVLHGIETYNNMVNESELSYDEDYHNKVKLVELELNKIFKDKTK